MSPANRMQLATEHRKELQVAHGERDEAKAQLRVIDKAVDEVLGPGEQGRSTAERVLQLLAECAKLAAASPGVSGVTYAPGPEKEAVRVSKERSEQAMKGSTPMTGPPTGLKKPVKHPPKAEKDKEKKGVNRD